MLSVAGAAAGEDAGKVACPVSEQRHSLTVDGGEDQLADLSVGNGLESVGIDNLYYVVVLPYMEAVLLFTFECYSRAAHLGHSEGVVGLDAQHILNTFASVFGVGLGADDKGVELDILFGVDTLLEHNIMQAGCIGGDGVYHCGTEIRKELQLTQCVSCSRGDGEHSEAFRPILESQSSGKHSITRSVLEYVTGATAYHPQTACDGIGPLLQIFLGMEDNGRVAGGA